MLHFETIFQNSPLPHILLNSFNSNELVQFLRSGTLFAYTSDSNETRDLSVFNGKGLLSCLSSTLQIVFNPLQSLTNLTNRLRVKSLKNVFRQIQKIMAMNLQSLPRIRFCEYSEAAPPNILRLEI